MTALNGAITAPLWEHKPQQTLDIIAFIKNFPVTRVQVCSDAEDDGNGGDRAEEVLAEHDGDVPVANGDSLCQSRRQSPIGGHGPSLTPLSINLGLMQQAAAYAVTLANLIMCVQYENKCLVFVPPRSLHKCNCSLGYTSISDESQVTEMTLRLITNRNDTLKRDSAVTSSVPPSFNRRQNQMEQGVEQADKRACTPLTFTQYGLNGTS